MTEPMEARAPVVAEARPAAAGGATVEQMSEWSFPASDPPSVWTWEVTADAQEDEAAGA